VWPEQDAVTYDAMFVLKEAIEKAGTIESDAVIAQIEKIDMPGTFCKRIAFEPKEAWKTAPHKAHQIKFGPGYITYVAVQWLNGTLVTVWPDGKALLGDKSWEGFKYQGTKDYQLPPWMVEYWKSKGKAE
jgi:branched-chain amino acid transport system substrate-binding protein